MEAFAIARFIGTSYDDEHRRPFKVKLISAATRPRRAPATGSPPGIRSCNGPSVVPDMFSEEALEEDFNVLMIPGGRGVDRLIHQCAPGRDELLEWVRSMDRQICAKREAGITSSVCTGAAPNCPCH